MPPLQGGEYCWAHSKKPEVEAQRTEARARGGKARHGRDIGTTGETHINPAEALTADKALQILNQELGAVLLLERSLGRARTVGYLLNVSIKVIETKELEAQLDRIEQMLAMLGAGDGSK